MLIDNHDLVLMAQKSGEAIASLASLSPTPLHTHTHSARGVGSNFEVERPLGGMNAIVS